MFIFAAHTLCCVHRYVFVACVSGSRRVCRHAQLAAVGKVAIALCPFPAALKKKKIPIISQKELCPLRVTNILGNDCDIDATNFGGSYIGSISFLADRLRRLLCRIQFHQGCIRWKHNALEVNQTYRMNGLFILFSSEFLFYLAHTPGWSQCTDHHHKEKKKLGIEHGQDVCLLPCRGKKSATA